MYKRQQLLIAPIPKHSRIINKKNNNCKIKDVIQGLLNHTQKGMNNLEKSLNRR